MQVKTGHRTETTGRVLAVVTLAAALLVPLAGTAHAACHAFTVEVDPATPSEGQTVTVTIRRDADVQPSSVRVRTVDGTATGGDDYTPLDERVEFEDGTERTREIGILDDDATEDDETFDVELSEGEGCEVNQNFSYDSATVTIQDDDAAAEEQPTEEESPTEASSPAEPETTSEDRTSQESGETEATAEELPETGSDGALLVLGLLGLLVGGGVLRRAHRPEA